MSVREEIRKAPYLGGIDLFCDFSQRICCELPPYCGLLRSACMRSLFAVLVLVLGLLSVAHADVWSWVDASGKTHFVDTKTSIYTWVDENGNVHYSDTPDHEAAVAVVLVWVSSGSIDQLQANNDAAGTTGLLPGET